MKKQFLTTIQLIKTSVVALILVAIVSCGGDDGPAVIPLATITSYSVSEGSAGAAVTIEGTNFSVTVSENKVWFNEIEAEVTGASATKIFTAVPQGASTGIISIQIGDAAKVVGAEFTVKENQIVVHLKHAADDAEEAEILFGATPAGFMELTSSDLEIVDIDSDFGYQFVGTRFRTIDIPKGAVITNAYIQFTADDIGVDPAKTRVHGETKDTGEFTDVLFNISSRTKTTASVLWDIPAWPTKDERLEAQRATGLEVIVQEIIDHADWTSGGNMTFIFTIEEGKEGSGREAETWSTEGDEAGDAINAGEESATLIIEFL